MIRFGPSGNPDKFYEDGNKASTQMPSWIKSEGLDAYEYQCSKGVKISEATAKTLGDEADKNLFKCSRALLYKSFFGGTGKKT